MMAKAKRLQQFVVSSWLMSGLMAFVASLLLFSLFGYYSYSQQSKISQKELDEKTQTIARRISGELLIAPRGAPESVALQVQKELGLSEVHFGSFDDIKSIRRSNEHLYSEMPMPFLENKYAVLTAAAKVNIWNHFNLLNLLLSVCLIGLVVGIGLFFQTRHFRKHLIKPIESLVDTSTGDKVICEQWPLEIQEISHKLSSSFQDRERVVYDQIARGVIHDVKTILQSLQVAADLANESPSEARLKNLLKVSQTKLPSLLSIIDTTLDGSREIAVVPKMENLIETVQKSLETSKSLSVAHGVSLLVENMPEAILAAHDSTQLERVFTNLLKNAFEAIDTKNSTDKIVRIAFNTNDKDFVGVTIEDSGVGLPKHPESVFRLLKSTKIHGSGLGLLVSRKIVDAHGGSLVATHSAELKGAKFEVRIPLKETNL